MLCAVIAVLAFRRHRQFLLSLLALREGSRGVGCASSSVDFYLHLVVCSGCFPAYRYTYVLEYVCENMYLYSYTYLAQV